MSKHEERGPTSFPDRLSPRRDRHQSCAPDPPCYFLQFRHRKKAFLVDEPEVIEIPKVMFGFPPLNQEMNGGLPFVDAFSLDESADAPSVIRHLRLQVLDVEDPMVAPAMEMIRIDPIVHRAPGPFDGAEVG